MTVEERTFQLAASMRQARKDGVSYQDWLATSGLDQTPQVAVSPAEQLEDVFNDL